MKKDEGKTKEQLINELVELRQRIAELEQVVPLEDTDEAEQLQLRECKRYRKASPIIWRL